MQLNIGLHVINITLPLYVCLVFLLEMHSSFVNDCRMVPTFFPLQLSVSVSCVDASLLCL